MKNNNNLYRWFNLWIVCSILSSLGVIALLNIIIDPYNVFMTPRITHFNKLKPEFDPRIRVSKLISLNQRTHSTLLLGSSRILGGMDVEKLNYTEYKKASNIGIPASHIDELKYYLEYALKHDHQQNIKKLVLGLDFYMFTTQPNERIEFIQKRMDQNIPISDLLAVSLSLQVINSSYKTLIYNQKYQDYPKRRTTAGEFRMWLGGFLDRNLWYNDYEIHSNKLDDLREILELCKDNNIQVYVFISPVHATHNQIIHLRGLWPTFEQWKREIVQITPVWDFSGYNSVTTEPVKDEMMNYIDNSHYSPKVGELILARMSNSHHVQIPDDFGVLLTPHNIENYLTEIRQQEIVWKQNHPEDVQLVEDINQYKLKLHSQSLNQ